MALTMSTHLANKVLDAIFNGDTVNYTDVYISLHSADPGDTGASEISGGSYARAATDSTFWTLAAGKLVDLDTAIEFSDMPGDTVTHIGLWDAATGGNFLWGGTLTESKTVPAGETLRFKATDITAQIDPA